MQGEQSSTFCVQCIDIGPNLAEFSEEKGEQPFRNAPVFALQDFLLMTAFVGNIDSYFVF